LDHIIWKETLSLKSTKKLDAGYWINVVFCRFYKEKMSDTRRKRLR
jgi:hypothetical protein